MFVFIFCVYGICEREREKERERERERERFQISKFNVS